MDGCVAKNEEKFRGLSPIALPQLRLPLRLEIGESRRRTKKWSLGEGLIARSCFREAGGCAEEMKSMGCIDRQRRRCILGILFSANGAAAAADLSERAGDSDRHRGPSWWLRRRDEGEVHGMHRSPASPLHFGHFGRKRRCCRCRFWAREPATQINIEDFFFFLSFFCSLSFFLLFLFFFGS